MLLPSLQVSSSQIIKATKQSPSGLVSLKVWLRINAKYPKSKTLRGCPGTLPGLRWTSAPGACSVVTTPVWDSWFCEPGSSSRKTRFLLQTAPFRFAGYSLGSGSRAHTPLQLSLRAWLPHYGFQTCIKLCIPSLLLV